jgi:four helix bundle protein
MQNEDKEKPELRVRTKRFALRIIRAYTTLAKTGEAQVCGHQMLRSGTSVGAHYREACRARSQAEFVSKMEVGLQELDETSYWMELLVESNTVKARKMSALMGEANELMAMFASSIITSKRRRDD